MNYDKLNDRIDQMFNERSFDEDFISIDMDEDVKSKILPYQYLHVHNLISIFSKSNCAYDGSSAGAGKTYTALAVCKHLNLIPLIICPKSIISMWRDVCEYFDIEPIDIINYESIKSNKELDYLEIIDDETNEKKFNWKLNKKNTIAIIDEAHKCKNIETLNGKLLFSLKNQCKILLLSATLSDTPKYFYIFGYLLGFFTDTKKANQWAKVSMKNDKNFQRVVKKQIFPHKGSCMTIEDIGNLFPDNQISIENYTISKEDISEIEEIYKNKKNQIVNVLRVRQKIEQVKTPIILELILKYLNCDKYVVVFVNFTKTLNTLKEELENMDIEYSEIHGQQEVDERAENINMFQENKVKVILCMAKCGGQSISLHDTKGGAPRVSIISPSYSVIDFIQILGRIDRSGKKSPTLQKIIFCAHTREQEVSKRLKTKIQFINELTDEDLTIKF